MPDIALRRANTTPVDRVTSAVLRAMGAKGRWVPTRHGRLYVRDLAGTGDLPPLVLVHGLSARGTHFAAMAHRMRRHFRRILLPDLLGHGRSELPPEPMRGPHVQESFDDALDALLDEPAVVYGNSLGGYGAIRHAARSPERVRALIVNSPGGAALESMTMQAYLDRFRVSTHGQALDFLGGYFGGPVPLRHVVARGVLRQLADPVVRAFLDALGEGDFLRAEHVAALRMPTLLLWGQRDKVMIPEQLAFFQRHLPPHARLEQPEGYGHAPYIEHPADLSRRILAFVRESLA